MKNKKRIIAVLVTAGVIAGGIFGFKFYRDLTRKVTVTPVSEINYGTFEDPMTTSGIVYDTGSQNIYPAPTQIIKEVYVNEGQSVSAGDPLMAYDIQSQQLTLKMKELQVQAAEQNLKSAKNELNTLIHTVPVDPIPDPDPEPEPDPDPEPEPVTPELSGDAWTALDKTVIGEYINKDDPNAGTLDDPIVYLVTPDAPVYGSFLNALRDLPEGTYIRIEAREGNQKDGALIAARMLNTSYLAEYEANTPYYVLPQISDDSRTRGGSTTDPETPGNPPPGADDSNLVGMTKEELAQAIADTKRRITELDLALRKAQLEYDIEKGRSADGVVRAEKDGVVRMVGDPANPPQNGDPFLSVSSGSGIYVQGTVSELLFDRVEVGSEVSCSSWYTGNMYTGHITEIDTYPVPGDSYYYGNNQNVSYYAFKANLEDADDLKPGEYLDMSFQLAGEAEGSIAISKAYVRSDSGGKYVMKDEDGRLVKQYVKVGKTYYGEITIILDGITEEDSLAFPYGDGAREGAKTEMDDSQGVIW